MSNFLESTDDVPLGRRTTGSMTARLPFVTVQPPSTGQRVTGRTGGSDPTSQRSVGSVALSMGGTSGNSDPSIRTASGIDKLPNIVYRTFQTGERGELIPPDTPPVAQNYGCPFDRLNCIEVFPDYEQWYRHSLKHFGKHPPPTRNSCCFCPKTFETGDGRSSWKERMKHVKKHHDRGETLATSRFDIELYRYLWLQKLLTELDWKDLTARRTDPRQGYNTHLKADDSLRPR